MCCEFCQFWGFWEFCESFECFECFESFESFEGFQPSNNSGGRNCRTQGARQQANVSVHSSLVGVFYVIKVCIQFWTELRNPFGFFDSSHLKRVFCVVVANWPTRHGAATTETRGFTGRIWKAVLFIAKGTLCLFHHGRRDKQLPTSLWRSHRQRIEWSEQCMAEFHVDLQWAD